MLNEAHTNIAPEGGLEGAVVRKTRDETKIRDGGARMKRRLRVGV